MTALDQAILEETEQSHGEAMYALGMALEAAKAGKATDDDWQTIEHACGMPKRSEYRIAPARMETLPF